MRRSAATTGRRRPRRSGTTFFEIGEGLSEIGEGLSEIDAEGEKLSPESVLGDRAWDRSRSEVARRSSDILSCAIQCSAKGFIDVSG
ncbi:MAG TPA: hypothetical protein VEJ87_08535, partial [Acidimicrobiales bacterium]|nr:hypothetical protein [Acidimicrobiales bacterium]